MGSRTQAEERSTGDLSTEARWRLELLLLLSGSTLSRLCLIGATMAYPLMALSLDGSPAFAGLVTAAGTFPILLFQLPAGVLADRFDRRRIMVASQLARAATLGILIWGLNTLPDPKPLLPLAAAIEGACSLLYSTALSAAVPQVVPEKAVHKAMSSDEAQNQAALAVGRPLAGALYELSRTPFLALNVLACLLSLGTLVLIRRGRFRLGEEDRAARTRLFPQIKESLHYLRADPSLRQALIVCSVTNLVFQAVLLLLMVLAEDKYGLSGTSIGLLLAASGVGGVVGAFTARPVLRRLELRHTAIACTWCWTLLTFFIVVSDHPLVLVLVWSGIGFIGAHMNVSLNVHQAKKVPQRLRGRIASWKSFTTRAPSALGALASGILITVLGTDVTAAMVFVSLLGLSICVSHRRWKVKFVIRAPRRWWEWRADTASPNKAANIKQLEHVP
ncbi:MFS transporter [Thermomonospora amylolytica]|uniref:MFS transporter n=1 Tax=Thermomonospora amylolytica TaxID=1411117 RepID=UPI000E6B83BB|nr:MFS transporter [Thermomonospora amylolytica]